MPKKETGTPSSLEQAQRKTPGKPGDSLDDALSALFDREIELSHKEEQHYLDDGSSEKEYGSLQEAQVAVDRAKEWVRSKTLEDAPVLLAELSSKELPTTAQKNELRDKKTSLARKMSAIDAELRSADSGMTQDPRRAENRANVDRATKKLEAMKKVLEEEMRPLHDEIQKLEGNFFTRVLNGSKIAELKERLTAVGKKHGINGDPFGVQELQIKHDLVGLENAQKYADRYDKSNPPVEVRAMGQEEMIRLKSEYEELALQEKQISKELLSLNGKMKKFEDIALALGLPIRAADPDNVKAKLTSFLKEHQE